MLALCTVLVLLPGTAQADIGFDISEETSATSPDIQTVTWNGWDIQYYYPSPSDAYYELSGGRGVVICYANGNSASFDIPEQINGQPVVGLVALGGYGLGVPGASNTVFGDCKQLTSVNIPDSVTHIVDAFHECMTLTSVTIPTSVTYIGKAAFYGCHALINVSIPDSVTYIGDGAFACCYRMDATIPPNITNLGCGAFFCTALTDVTIPNGITRIEDSVFAGTKLSSVNIPNNITSIGKWAFQSNYNLTSVYIPNSVTTIKDLAFFDCPNLTSIDIPNSVTTIGRGAFRCGLTSVNIPNSITCIEDSVFAGTNLTSVTIPSSVTSIGKSAFSSCTSLTSIDIPDSVTSIGDYAFFRTGLNHVTFPGSVKFMVKYVFVACAVLSSATFSDGVRNIGDYTFHDCTALKTISIPKSVTFIDSAAFDCCPKIGTVYYGGSETYKNTNLQIEQIGVYDGANGVVTDDGDIDISEADGKGKNYLLNANWIYTDDSEYITPHQIVFDANGGTISDSRTMTTDSNGKLSSLPTPTRTGYTFTGWYTAPTGGTRITTDTVFTQDTTVYAQWTFKGSGGNNNIGGSNTGGSSPSSGSSSSDSTSPISVPSVTGGKVSVSPKAAPQGATVTLTVTPDSGYELDKIRAVNSKGIELPLMSKGNSKYTFAMSNSGVSIEVSFKKIPSDQSSQSTVSVVPDTPPMPFIDVNPGNWCYDAVQYVYKRGLMRGNGNDTTFDPNGEMNRAMVWTVLGRMDGADVGNSGSSWYSNAQAWAVSSQVSDGSNPGGKITRAELTTMLWRYAGSPVATFDLSVFNDSSSVANWANAAMQWAASTGVISGSNGSLNPSGDARRSEVAAILMRFSENIK